MLLKRQRLAAAVFCLGLGCGSPVASEQIGNSVWGSDAADLTVRPDSSTLRLLASGGCVGSYVEVGVPMSSPAFDLTGTFTQLIGAYPGRLTYAAHVTGTLTGDHLHVTVTVPSLTTVIGPFDLTRGASHNWMNCLYP
jgi:hypothetical protein